MDLLGHKSHLPPHICHPASPTHLTKQSREEGRLSSSHLGGRHFKFVWSSTRITLPTTAIRLPSLISIFIFLKHSTKMSWKSGTNIARMISHLRTGTVFLLPQQNEAFLRVIRAGMESLKAKLTVKRCQRHKHQCVPRSPQHFIPEKRGRGSNVV